MVGNTCVSDLSAYSPAAIPKHPSSHLKTPQHSSENSAFSCSLPSSQLPLSLPRHGEQERVNPVTFNQGLVYTEED